MVSRPAALNTVSYWDATRSSLLTIRRVRTDDICQPSSRAGRYRYHLHWGSLTTNYALGDYFRVLRVMMNITLCTCRKVTQESPAILEILLSPLSEIGNDWSGALSYARGMTEVDFIILPMRLHLKHTDAIVQLLGH